MYPGNWGMSDRFGVSVGLRHHPNTSPVAPRPWVLDGACVGTDPELFFPQTELEQQWVQRICAACPVIAECAAWALEVESGFGAGHRFGIYGGLTPEDRAEIDSERRQHGAYARPRREVA